MSILKMSILTKNLTSAEIDTQLDPVKSQSLYPNNEDAFGSLQASTEGPWQDVSKRNYNKNKSPLKKHAVHPTVNATDKNIVVKGLRLDISGEILVRYLQSKGITSRECNVLTTYENAKSLAYKLTIDSCDESKLKDPTL